MNWDFNYSDGPIQRSAYSGPGGQDIGFGEERDYRSPLALELDAAVGARNAEIAEMIDPATGEPYGDDGVGATGGSAWGMGNRIPGMLPGHTGLPFQMDESGQWKTGPDGEKIPAWDPGFVPNLFPEMPHGTRKEKSFRKLSRQIREINDRRAAQGKERLHNPLPDAVADRYERQLDMIARMGKNQNLYMKYNPVSYRGDVPAGPAVAPGGDTTGYSGETYDPSGWAIGDDLPAYVNSGIDGDINRKIEKFEKLSANMRAKQERKIAEGKMDFKPRGNRTYGILRNDLIKEGIRQGMYVTPGMTREETMENYDKNRPRIPSKKSKNPISSIMGKLGFAGGGIVKRRFAIGDLAVAEGGLGSVLEEEEIIEGPEISAAMGPGMDLGGMQGSEIDYGATSEEEFREAVSDAVSDRLIAEQVGEPLSPESMQQVDELVALFVERYGQDAFGEIVAEQAAILGIPVPGEEGEIIEEEYVSPEGLTEETMGIIGEAEGYRRGGRIRGPGDGMSDSISANIDGVEPIAVSSGETIIPADATAALGNGDTAAGARRLMEMVDRIRMAKTGMLNQPPAIDPNDFTIA